VAFESNQLRDMSSRKVLLLVPGDEMLDQNNQVPPLGSAMVTSSQTLHTERKAGYLILFIFFCSFDGTGI
jgi:hypothetical protein